MSESAYTPGGDVQVIAGIAKAHFGDFTKMFDHHGWPERGQDMMRKVQTRVVETYGSVRAFDAHFRTVEKMRNDAKAIWTDDMSVLFTSFWGWTPETWGTVGWSGDRGRTRRANLLKELSDPFICVCYVTSNRMDIDPAMKGMIGGFYLVSHETGDRDQFTHPAHHGRDPDKWRHSLRAIRAFNYLPEYRPRAMEFFPDLSGTARTVSAMGKIITDTAKIDELRDIPWIEVPVYSSRMNPNEIIEDRPFSGMVFPGPDNAGAAEPDKKSSRSPREERIIAGFEDIQRFVDEHGRTPAHGENNDIFERLYAVRLDRLRSVEECRVLLEPLDREGVLDVGAPESIQPQGQSDEALLSALGVEGEQSTLTDLQHVRSSADKRAADEIAQREKCPDFEKFKPVFEQVQRELDAGIRNTRPFQLKSEIRPGRMFIVGGQKAYVAEMDDIYTNAQGRTDARMRVVFDNGTQSGMLMRSLQRALHNDDASRRISDPNAGPLFASDVEEGDEDSGTIYVLRSRSDLTVVVENRDLLHKVGVTGGSVERRIANAKLEATYLLADVEIVSTYKLMNINRTRLETLLHRVLEPARLDIKVKDRFGNPVIPREWFLVPLFVIDDAVEKIRAGTVHRYVYDPHQAKLVEREPPTRVR